MSSLSDMLSSFQGRFSGRFAAPVAVALAVAGFLFLRHGRLGAGPRALAYAESVHHQIGATVNGRIKEVRVHVGQRVKAGETLVLLEDRAVLAARDRANAQLEKLRADVTAATLDEDTRVSRSEIWTLKTRADEGSDRAELDEVTRQMDRLNGLLERQLIPASEVEATRQKLSTLAARVKAYDQAIGRGQAGLDTRYSGHAKALAARLEPYRQAVVVQEAAVKQLELALDELTVRAASDGVVSSLLHQTGDVVQPGVPLVVVVTSRPRTIIAIVSEATAAKVSLGTVAEIRRDTMIWSPMIEGRVVELAPEVEEIPPRARPSPTVPAWGRRATIELGPGPDVLPGEGFNVVFR
jgi:multidrug resistance efflux pump